MTYREKLQKEHPECVDDRYVGGCSGCPNGWGYGPEACGNRACLGYGKEPCAKCWDKVIPGTEEDKYKNLTREELIEFVNHLERTIELEDKEIQRRGKLLNEQDQKIAKLEGTCAVYRSQSMQTYGTCCCKADVLAEKDKEIERLKEQYDGVLKAGAKLTDELSSATQEKEYWYRRYCDVSNENFGLHIKIDGLEIELEKEKKEHQKHHGFFGYFHVG